MWGDPCELWSVAGGGKLGAAAAAGRGGRVPGEGIWLNPCLCAQSRARPNKQMSWRLEQRMVYGETPSKESGQPVLKRPKFLAIFREGFKVLVGVRGCRGMTLALKLVGGEEEAVFQKSPSSPHWFQPVWGLGACGQQVVTNLHLGSRRTTQTLAFDRLNILGRLGLLFYLIRCYCLLAPYPSFLHSLTFLIRNCLNLLFGMQQRLRR